MPGSYFEFCNDYTLRLLCVAFSSKNKSLAIENTEILHSINMSKNFKQFLKEF